MILSSIRFISIEYSLLVETGQFQFYENKGKTSRNPFHYVNGKDRIAEKKV
jgi:hypothetical protein